MTREQARKLEVVPCTLREAFAFVEQHHRHHKPPQGGLFAIGAACENKIIGVAIVGRPVARHLGGDYVAEVTRLCTDGTQNACSLLYAAAWRTARSMGYRKLITYTLPSEGGGSLRAAGWRIVGQTSGGTWARPSRPRVDTHPLEPKFKWEIE